MRNQAPTHFEMDRSKQQDGFVTVLLWSCALAATVVSGFLFSLWWQSSVRDEHAVLRLASQQFVDGHLDVAGELAESVSLDRLAAKAVDSSLPGDASGKTTSQAGPTPDLESETGHSSTCRPWWSLREFLVGMGRVVNAHQQQDSHEQLRLLVDGITHLESSQTLGFPPGRITQGYRVLGESLFHVGRYDEASEALAKAMDQDPSQRRTLLPMLAESQLHAAKQDAEPSLQAMECYVLDQSLSPAQRMKGEAIRVQALIALRRWEQVRQAIRELSVRDQQQSHSSLARDHQSAWSEHQSELQLLESIADVTQAIEQFGRYGGAGDTDENPGKARQQSITVLTKTLQRLQQLEGQSPPELAAQARIWAGRAYLVQGRSDDALTQFAAVRQQRPFGAASILAGLEEIELLARQERGAEVMQVIRILVRAMEDDRGFDARLIPLTVFQHRLFAAIDRLRELGQFQAAIDAARSLPPVFPLVDALEHEAVSYRQWADVTMTQGMDVSGEIRPEAVRQAHRRYRAAGDAFARAAMLQMNSPDYPKKQWLAIDAYQRGRQFSQSIRLLDSYLRYESISLLPRGLVAYGRALLAENDPAAAIQKLRTCIEDHPRDPHRYEARLIAAWAYAETGDFDNAKQQLQDNLEDGELTPQSPEWRDSLFTLGELLYQSGVRNHLLAQQSPPDQLLHTLRENHATWSEAIRRLDEAVERYWPLARAESAIYLSARAQIMSSIWPIAESQRPELLEVARSKLRIESDRKLHAALDRFERLRGHLDQRQADQPLRQDQQLLLRNSLLAQADVLKQLDRFEEASLAYRAVEMRYMDEPLVLEAIVGRVDCARRMGRLEEVEPLMRRASQLLQRIPDEMDERFVETTRYDRRGWEQWLGWINRHANGDAARGDNDGRA